VVYALLSVVIIAVAYNFTTADSKAGNVDRNRMTTCHCHTSPRRPHPQKSVRRTWANFGDRAFSAARPRLWKNSPTDRPQTARLVMALQSGHG